MIPLPIVKWPSIGVSRPNHWPQRRAFSGALWWCMCGIARTETTAAGFGFQKWIHILGTKSISCPKIFSINQVHPDVSRCIQMYPGLLNPGSYAPKKSVVFHMGGVPMLKYRCETIVKRFAEIPLKTDQWGIQKRPWLGLIHIVRQLLTGPFSGTGFWPFWPIPKSENKRLWWFIWW